LSAFQIHFKDCGRFLYMLLRWWLDIRVNSTVTSRLLLLKSDSHIIS
jgi:hypothetical protein